MSYAHINCVHIASSITLLHPRDSQFLTWSSLQLMHKDQPSIYIVIEDETNVIITLLGGKKQKEENYD